MVGTGLSLLRLDVGRSNHLAPLLGFLRDELSEIGRRAAKHRAVQVGKPYLDLGIGEAGTDLLVQLVDYLGGRILGRAEAKERTRLVAWDGLSDGRDIRERCRARRGGYRKSAQLAGLDVRNRQSRVGEEDLHLPAEQIGQRGRYA